MLLHRVAGGDARTLVHRPALVAHQARPFHEALLAQPPLPVRDGIHPAGERRLEDLLRVGALGGQRVPRSEHDGAQAEARIGLRFLRRHACPVEAERRPQVLGLRAHRGRLRIAGEHADAHRQLARAADLPVAARARERARVAVGRRFGGKGRARAVPRERASRPHHIGAHPSGAAGQARARPGVATARSDPGPRALRWRRRTRRPRGPAHGDELGAPVGLRQERHLQHEVVVACVLDRDEAVPLQYDLVCAEHSHQIDHAPRRPSPFGHRCGRLVDHLLEHAQLRRSWRPLMQMRSRVRPRRR